MSLAMRLAYWTGRDCSRIERLMRRCELARDKWDDRPDYLQRTILAACAWCSEVRTERTSQAEDNRGLPNVPNSKTMSTFSNHEHLRQPTAGEVKLVRGDDIQPEPICWLWKGYLAQGKLHILAGPAGTGKTTLAIAMAAIVSTGARWPDGTSTAGGAVLVWSGEDGLADSLLPRLIANGGDRRRVYFVEGVVDGMNTRPFDPAMDMQKLTEAARAIEGLRLVIVDPVVSAVAGDSHKNAEVRRGLQPLVDLAAELNVAVLGISHFSKGTQGRDPVERVNGSLAYAAVARVVLCTARPAEDGAKRRMVRAKSNIGPDGGGFEYDLEQALIDEGSREVFGQRVGWGQAIDGTARNLLSEVEDAQPGGRTLSPALDSAVEFLRNALAGGPVAATSIRKEAVDAGHAAGTISRAKDRLGVVSRKESMSGRWDWTLPDAARAEDTHEFPKARMIQHVGIFDSDEPLPSVESQS